MPPLAGNPGLQVWCTELTEHGDQRGMAYASCAYPSLHYTGAGIEEHTSTDRK